jgi:hypothetical protein
VGAPDPRVSQLAKLWTPVGERGSLVVAIGDNPLLSDEESACTAALTSAKDASRCDVPRSKALAFNDPLKAAVELTPNARFVDMTDLYCTDTVCPTVIGNVYVYRDTNHLTATYAHTVTPYLYERLDAAFNGLPKPSPR